MVMTDILGREDATPQPHLNLRIPPPQSRVQTLLDIRSIRFVPSQFIYCSSYTPRVPISLLLPLWYSCTPVYDAKYSTRGAQLLPQSKQHLQHVSQAQGFLLDSDISQYPVCSGGTINDAG